MVAGLSWAEEGGGRKWGGSEWSKEAGGRKADGRRAGGKEGPGACSSRQRAKAAAVVQQQHSRSHEHKQDVLVLWPAALLPAALQRAPELRGRQQGGSAPSFRSPRVVRSATHQVVDELITQEFKWHG